jgi:hypothetical protein
MPTFLNESSLLTVFSKPASGNMSNAVLSVVEEEQSLFPQPKADDICNKFVLVLLQIDIIQFVMHK